MNCLLSLKNSSNSSKLKRNESLNRKRSKRIKSNRMIIKWSGQKSVHKDTQAEFWHATSSRMCLEARYSNKMDRNLQDSKIYKVESGTCVWSHLYDVSSIFFFHLALLTSSTVEYNLGLNYTPTQHAGHCRRLRQPRACFNALQFELH